MKFKHAVGEKVLCFEPDETKARVLYNAKIMDADIVKDAKGKKFVEYKIHFQGWNHAWDRWAEESFVLKDNEQNRKLQRKLARKAIRKLKLQKGKKRHHLPGVGNKGEGEEKLQLDSSSDESFDSDFTNSTRGKSESEEEESVAKRPRLHFGSSPAMHAPPPVHEGPPEEDSSSSKDENHLRRIVNLDIPLPLQRRLEEDNIMITKRNMLVDLPVRPNVVQILENYVKKFAISSVGAVDKHRFTTVTGTGQSVGMDLLPPDKRLSLCQEICSDLKLLFDYILPLSLLYIPEREQFKQLIKMTKIQDDRKDEKSVKSPIKEELKSTSKKLDFDNVSPGKDDPAIDVVNIEEGSPSPAQVSDVKIQAKNTRVTSLSESSEVPAPPPPPLKKRSVSESISSPGEGSEHSRPHKKKTAEEQLIEETHKYLIPNQPNLDQTGLSKDSQGRRRSSRLSHPDYSSLQMSFYSEENYRMSTNICTTFQEKDLTPDSERSPKSKAPKLFGTPTVTNEPYIFLRKPTKFKHFTFAPGTEGNASCSSNRQHLFNYNPYMDKDLFLSYAGSDIKKIVEMAKTWNWCIVPRSYRPEEGASIPPSLIYGIHHLLRLFVKLPSILIRMEIPEFKLKILIKHLNMLLKFLNEYERELFEVDAYVYAT